jgi:hypothetical protein
MILKAVEDAGGFRGALERLKAPVYAGAFDDLSYSTLRGWYKEGSGNGKKMLKEEVKARWQGGEKKVRGMGTGKSSFFDENPELCDEIRANLNHLRECSTTVNSVTVSSIFKAIVGARKPGLLTRMKFSRRWCRKWVTRWMCWSFKKGTTSGQKLPPDWANLVEASIARSATICASYRITHPALVINWDQTGLLLMPTHNRTYHHRKDKHVQVVALEDKRQITAVTASTMNGELLPLQLIFAGQDQNHNEQRAVPKDKQTTYLVSKHKWKLEQTKNHWSSLYTMQMKQHRNAEA